MEAVWIDFVSHRNMDGEQVTHEFSARGYIQNDDENFILQFSEPGVEGLEGQIQTKLTATPTQVAMVRTGAIQMQQTFVLAKRSQGSYRVPYGRLATIADTKELTYCYDDSQGVGQFFVRYNFYLETEFSGEFTIELKIRPM